MQTARARWWAPAGEDGVVEIGYSVVPRWQRRGYASEIVDALIARALELPRVTRVIAHTTPGNTGSIGVLRRCGFTDAGAGAERGTIRFELPRGAETSG